MTFGGIQGFTRKPFTPWFDDDGNFAGIVHEERGALVFLREFILGSNPNRTVSGSNVVGGENTTLAGDLFPGGDEIFFGSSTTAGTSTIPAATRSARASFIATAATS
ncbi:hypothetical protein B0H14DRAFT_2359133 [Mycena olivaceomarginata]|nr:hypothetical protein B0H14DRAFT_2359133 [Mycena olivaceomarginata]